MKYTLKLISACLFIFIQGCTSTTEQKGSDIGQLLIAEPLPVDYKNEVAIARLTEMILRADITEEQRAQLYYDRGVRYDSVGLMSLARLDFNLALRLKPNYVDAYNFIGIHYTQLQEFNQAYEYFDSTLDLAPDHEYAHLNRGIALYYGGRPKLAEEDLLTFYQNDINDPYRVLWLYLIERDIDQESALKELKLRTEHVDQKVWAKNILSLYSGDISQSEFFNLITLDVRTNNELTERLCEGYFYLAKYHQFLGNDSTAANFFKLAISTNVYEFVEHRYAKLELELMRAQYQRKLLEPAK